MKKKFNTECNKVSSNEKNPWAVNFKSVWIIYDEKSLS